MFGYAGECLFMYSPAAATGRRLGATDDKQKYLSKFYEEGAAVLLPSVSETDSESYYLHVPTGDWH